MGKVQSKAIPLANLRVQEQKPVRFGSDQRTVKEAFPDVDPGVRPCGERLTVQLRTPLTMTKGGIHVTDETRETEMWNEQTGIVRYVGPLAFRKRDTMEYWPEGAWCQPGDFVRIPKYNADRIVVQTGPKAEDIALFVTLKDVEVVATVPGDPLAIKSFV